MVVAQAFQLNIDHDGSRMRKSSVSFTIRIMENADMADEGAQSI
jgi:hypothetical protein